MNLNVVTQMSCGENYFVSVIVPFFSLAVRQDSGLSFFFLL